MQTIPYPQKAPDYLHQLVQSNFFNNPLVSNGSTVIPSTSITDPKVIGKYINAVGTSFGDEFFKQNSFVVMDTEITSLLR